MNGLKLKTILLHNPWAQYPFGGFAGIAAVLGHYVGDVGGAWLCCPKQAFIVPSFPYTPLELLLIFAASLLGAYIGRRVGLFLYKSDNNKEESIYFIALIFSIFIGAFFGGYFRS